MHSRPDSRRISSFAPLLIATLLLVFLPASLLARGGHHDRGGLPEVLAHLKALQADVSAVRAQLDDLSTRLSTLEGAPMTVETRYCFERETFLSLRGDLRAESGFGTDLAVGTDAFGNAALAFRNTEAIRAIAAGHGAATRGSLVICVSGGTLALDRPLDGPEAALVDEMQDTAASLRDQLAGFAAAADLLPADAADSPQLLLGDPLGFETPGDVATDAQFEELADGLPAPAPYFLTGPGAMLGQSAGITDLCGWLDSVSSSLDPQFDAAMASRCADGGGVALTDTVQTTGSNVELSLSQGASTYSFLIGPVFSTLGSIHNKVDSIESNFP